MSQDDFFVFCCFFFVQYTRTLTSPEVSVRVYCFHMSYLIVGLGNPDSEYEKTRHNAGRDVVRLFGEKNNLPEWHEDKKTKSLRSEGKVGKEAVTLLLPQTYVNKSGNAVLPLITSKKKAATLVVVHDDMDLPLGRMKISFARNSGGHKGIESIMRAVKTNEFIRLRLGVSPTSASGKTKKPSGEEAVIKFVLGKWKGEQEQEFKTVMKRACEALATIVTEGKERAMGEFN